MRPLLFLAVCVSLEATAATARFRLGDVDQEADSAIAGGTPVLLVGLRYIPAPPDEVLMSKPTEIRQVWCADGRASWLRVTAAGPQWGTFSQSTHGSRDSLWYFLSFLPKPVMKPCICDTLIALSGFSPSDSSALKIALTEANLPVFVLAHDGERFFWGGGVSSGVAALDNEMIGYLGCTCPAVHGEQDSTGE